MTNPIRQLLVLAMATIFVSCTVSNTPAPPLTGPSELSLSLAISANPDVLSMDGVSQSVVTVEARDENGQLKANVPLRLEIIADGQSVEYGSLSARTLATGSNGRATFSYTAPTLVGTSIPKLDIAVTPTGTGDAASHQPRYLTIRLVAPGVILPGGLTAVFTFTPTLPTAHVDALFDASQSAPPVGGAIVSYQWNFGDGSTGSGKTIAHRFAAGTYTVTLTTTDTNGLTASSSQLVQVQPGTPPVAVFVFSPTQPKVDQNIFFNAGQSTAGTGRQIVSYKWNFGDGTTSSGVTRSWAYANPGTYVVVLTVTDDGGQVGTQAIQITVCPLAGCT